MTIQTSVSIVLRHSRSFSVLEENQNRVAMLKAHRQKRTDNRGRSRVPRFGGEDILHLLNALLRFLEYFQVFGNHCHSS